MTSAKYFSRWLREAERSHLAGGLSWGLLSLYMVMTIVDLSADTEYVFFGLGSMELCGLSAGLGLAFAMIEFFYLFHARQQDFYYSLPVKKSTIFLSRYVHGLCQFLAPLLLTQIVLGVYEAVNSQNFAACAGAYVGRSIGSALLVFLVFYHTGIFAVVIAGKVITAVAAAAVFLFYFQVVIQNIFYGYVKEFYRHFYRSPLLEEAQELLVPLNLAKRLMGTGLYDWQEVWEYLPEGKAVCAAVLWAGIFLALSVPAYRSRRTERTGRAFTCALAERTIQAAVSLLGGMGLGILLMDVTGTAEYGAAPAVLLGVSGMAGACGIHLLTECLVRMPGTAFGRRRWQMCGAGVCAFAVGCIFLGNKAGFDGYLPERASVEEVAVSVGGIDMKQKQFVRGEDGDDSVAEERLLWYSLAEEESIDAGLAWIEEVLAGMGDSPGADQLTSATVCCHLKDGSRCYRRYPLDQRALDSFAQVYETKEYKKRAYPLAEAADLKKAQILWTDGVTETAVKLSAQEKENFLAAYKEDVADLKMDMLKTAFPAGAVEITSEVDGIYLEAMIYPFFRRTCRVLENAGNDVGKSLADYRIAALKVQTQQPVPQGVTGGVTMQFFDEENDIAEWSGKLIPEKLAVQPVLCPVDPSMRAEAEVEEEGTGASVVVDCFLY